jgi:hypothetical protein
MASLKLGNSLSISACAPVLLEETIHTLCSWPPLDRGERLRILDVGYL